MGVKPILIDSGDFAEIRTAEDPMACKGPASGKLTCDRKKHPVIHLDLKMCIGMLAVAFVSTAGAEISGRRIVQLDLARQMESPTFVSNYIDRVSSLGYDTLQLYLEARVATPTFSLPPDESYSREAMRGLVAHAAGRGMTVVPVVSLLGHAYHFFRFPGCDDYLEKPSPANLRLGDGRDTFCMSNPKTREFLASYVKDLADVFTGPYFHAGFDEAWNSGTCDLCREKELRDELFAESVLFAHGVLAKLGKRMWMWDDFFPFHPKALARLPKDIVMCHWCYDENVSDRGTRLNFAGRQREDMLEKYARLGFDSIPCCWYRTDNLRTFAAYARRSRTFGFMITQWEELIENFHGGSYPRVVAAKLMMDDPTRYQLEDVFVAACRRTFPSLNAVEAQAAAHILRNPDNALAVAVLKASAVVPKDGAVDADPLSERAFLDDLLMRGEIAVAAGKLDRAERELADPRRTERDVALARSVLEKLVPELDRLENRRQAQVAAWRPGRRSCFPRRQVANLQERAIRDLKAAAVAAADEKWLEVELTLVDRYGVPWWKAFGRFDGAWREIAAGVWKPGAHDHPAFTQRCRFTSVAMPDAVRLEHHGFGDAAVRYVSVCDRSARVRPFAISATDGNVRDAAHILTDDYSEARFGIFGFLSQYYDRQQQEQISSVTVELK